MVGGDGETVGGNTVLAEFGPQSDTFPVCLSQPQVKRIRSGMTTLLVYDETSHESGYNVDISAAHKDIS